MIEEVLLKYLAVFFAPQLRVDRVHARIVPATQRLFHRATIEVEHEEAGHVRHLTGQRNHVGIFEVELAHLVAVTEFNWHLTKRVVVQPKLLKVRKFADLR